MTAKAKEKPTTNGATHAPAPPATETEDHESLRLIWEAEERAADSEAEYLRSKEATKGYKEAFDSDVARLRALIRDRKKGLPLFEKPAETETDPDAWRSRSVASLGLSDDALAVVSAAGVATAGELWDWFDTNDSDSLSLPDYAAVNDILEALKSAPDEPKWRSVPVGSLGLQVAVADALRDAELRTAGAVSDFIDAREDLSGFDGIGPDDEEAISGAIDDLIDLERSGVDPTNRGGAKDADEEPEPAPQPRKRGRPRKAKASP